MIDSDRLRPMTHGLLPLLAALMLVSTLALPSFAVAAPSALPQAAAPIVTENFDAASNQYSLAPWTSPPYYPGTKYWGRLTNKGVGNSGGLWCAGTGGAWPTYPAGSAGYAVFELPALADFYESSVSFQYIMQTLGDYDANSFALKWVAQDDPSSPAIMSGVTQLPKVQNWTSKTFLLTDPTLEDIGMEGGNLSRRAQSHVTFFWADKDEGGGVVNLRTGTGPTVDNVSIGGWRYGPVRNLTAGVSGGNVGLSWARPLRSTRKTDVSGAIVEERTIGYAVWRALKGTSNWTRLTPSAITATSFTDAAAASQPSGTYTYLVQAWDSSDRAGKPATKDVNAGSAGHAPVAAPDSYGVARNTPLSVSAPGVLANDTDADGNILSAVLVGDVSRGTLSLNSNGGFTYTPDTDYAGSDSFTYRTTDGTFSSGTVTVTLTVDAPVVLVPVYRFYNLKQGVHFYTASAAEKDNVLKNLSATYKYEGISYQINVSNPDNKVPLYRFYNVKKGVHFYTANETEKNNVIKNLSATYKFEGVAYKVSQTPAGGTPVYRFYNVKAGVHFYTASAAEKDNVMKNLSATYKYEGIGYYIGN